jgi:hypothetical protein
LKEIVITVDEEKRNSQDHTVNSDQWKKDAERRVNFWQVFFNKDFQNLNCCGDGDNKHQQS